MTISDQLRDEIKKRGLYAVAKGSGVDYSALMRFVKGERGLNLDSASKVAEYLELKLCRDRKAGD